MNKRPHNRSVFTASLALVIIAASGMASAAPEKNTKRDKDILRGPDVTSTTTNTQTTTSDSMKPNDSMQSTTDAQTNRPVIFREYLLALRQMRNAQSGKSLSLSQEQQEQIKGLVKDHREAMKQFNENHKEEIRAMRDEIKATQGDDKENRPNHQVIEKSNKADMDSKRANPAREKLRSFVDNAPPNRAAINRLKGILSSDQQSLLKAKIVEFRAKRSQGDRKPNQSRQGNRPQRDGNQADRPQRDRTQRKDMDSDQAKREHKKRSKKNKEQPPLTPAQDD